MAYKACFPCELLFEVPDDAVDRADGCPQCGQLLVLHLNEAAGRRPPAVEPEEEERTTLFTGRGVDLAALAAPQPAPEPVLEPTVALRADLVAGLRPPSPAPAPVPVPAPAPHPAPTSDFDAPLEGQDDLSMLVGAQQMQAVLAEPRSPALERIRRRRRARLAWLAVLACLVGGIAAGVYWLKRHQRPAGTAAAAPAAAEGEQSELTRALAETDVQLTEGRPFETLAPGPYVAAGPDGLRTSTGPVVGLISTAVPPNQLERDEAGVWIAPLAANLKHGNRRETDLLVLAIDARETARTLLRFAYSGYRAGYSRFGLAVRPPREPEAPGVAEVTLHLPDSAVPSAGIAVVRVGRLGVYADVEARDGKKLSEGDGHVPRQRAGGPLDHDGIGRRLDALIEKHPIVRDAVVHLDPDLPMTEVAALLATVRFGDQRDRYPGVRVAPDRGP